MVDGKGGKKNRHLVFHESQNEILVVQHPLTAARLGSGMGLVAWSGLVRRGRPPVRKLEMPAGLAIDRFCQTLCGPHESACLNPKTLVESEATESWPPLPARPVASSVRAKKTPRAMDGGQCALDLNTTAKEDTALSASPPRTNGIAEHHEEDLTHQSSKKASPTTIKSNGKGTASLDRTGENNGYEMDGDVCSSETDASLPVSNDTNDIDNFASEKATNGDDAVALSKSASNGTDTTCHNNNNNHTSNSNGNHGVNGESDNIETEYVTGDATDTITANTANHEDGHEIGAGDADVLRGCDDGDEIPATKQEHEAEPLQISECAEPEAGEENGTTQTNGHTGHQSDSASPPPLAADGGLSSCSPPLLPAPAAAIPPGHYPYHHHHPHHPHQHHHVHHHHHPGATGYYLGTTSPSSSSPSNGGAVSPPILAGAAPILQQPASPSPPGSYPSSSAGSRGDSPGEGGSGGGSSPTGGGQHVVHVHVNPGETFSVRLGDQMQHIQGEYHIQRFKHPRGGLSLGHIPVTLNTPTRPQVPTRPVLRF
ncbi:trithorax group protein osa-like [Elysia marginata]|uniref:Trithorax group protein osa-like n=1 Tax=Elysia marginata TaxID=1093978 RepID=A0AAV4F2S3_9GAST|nr:trithorax group protein osa-like [Elysia marginata]